MDFRGAFCKVRGRESLIVYSLKELSKEIFFALGRSILFEKRLKSFWLKDKQRETNIPAQRLESAFQRDLS